MEIGVCTKAHALTGFGSVYISPEADAGGETEVQGFYRTYLQWLCRITNTTVGPVDRFILEILNLISRLDFWETLCSIQCLDVRNLSLALWEMLHFEWNCTSAVTVRLLERHSKSPSPRRFLSEYLCAYVSNGAMCSCVRVRMHLCSWVKVRVHLRWLPSWLCSLARIVTTLKHSFHTPFLSAYPLASACACVQPLRVGPHAFSASRVLRSIFSFGFVKIYVVYVRVPFCWASSVFFFTHCILVWRVLCIPLSMCKFGYDTALYVFVSDSSVGFDVYCIS